METLRGRAFYRKQHNQFSILNMLLNHLASNINGFLRKLQCFSLQLNGAVLHIFDVPHDENADS
jgi:hypothetical protein